MSNPEEMYSHISELKVLDWENLPVFFGPRELATFMGICINKAYQLSKSNGFPSMRIGRNIRISRDGLRKWVEMQIEEDLASQNK